MDCLFCKIIAGEIPSYKVYEDENFLAILDRFPAAAGTVLILTKRHAADIFALTEEEAAGILPLAKRVAEKIRNKLSPDGVNILQNNGTAAGQEILHYHMHVIPRHIGDAVRIIKPPTDPPLSLLEEMAGLLRL